MTDRTNPLIGKRIVKVWLASDKMALRFDVEGGDPVIVRCDADCCSETWIEGIDAPSALLGVVSAVDDLDMPDLGQMDGRDVVAYYGCKITTDNGACVIDYRNDSNGYYGGDLSWSGSFYGGVYGQNNSSQDWQLVASAPTPEGK